MDVAADGRRREYRMTMYAVIGTDAADYWTFVVCAGVVCAGAPSRLAIDVQLECHPHQLRQRWRAHLHHDAGAVDFHRFLAGSESVGDELVRQTRGDERHYLALSRREASVALGERGALVVDGASKRVAGESPADGGEERR